MDNDMQGRALLYSALVSAVSDGDLSRVEVLVYCFSPSSSQEWFEGYALLVDAIKQKHTEIAKLLIRNGAKVNSHCKEDSNAPLILAVMNDEDEIVNMLLNRGADIHVKNTRGYTPLHLAVVNGDIGIIVLLLRRGADVHVKDTRGYTSLHCAVEKSSEEMVTLLLDSNANVDAKATDGTTPLHIAAEKGHIQIAKVLLNHGADVHSVCNSTERDGYMPIHFSAQLGSEEAVRFFLRKGADVNAKAKDNLTPLHLAIKAHHEAVVKLLLEGGANVDARDKSGKTILHFAVEKGNSRIVEDVLKYCSDIINESNRSSLETTVQGSRDILQHGFIVNPEDVNNPELLHNAVTNGYLKTVGDLLKCGADVNMLDNSISGRGATPLHTAAMKNQVEIAKLLINYGANVNSKDKRERTPIFYAVEQEDAEIFKLLLTNGATIKDSPDVLFIAAKGRCLEIVEELLNCGIDVNMLDSSKSGRGNTALHYAVKVMENDAAKLLINYGANVNAKDNWGRTPIYYAIERNNEELTKLLLTNGANIKDSPEYLHIAIARGYVKIVEHLLMCGADVNYSDKQGRTALYIINRKRDLCVSVSSSVVNIDIHEREKIVELLLSNGANVNAKTEDGITALHAAVASGHSKIVEILLKFGAEVNFRDAYGRTALYIAIAGSGNAKIVEILLKFGAEVYFTYKHGRTALYTAIKKGHIEVVNVLLEYGSDINITCKRNYTPLEYACTKYNTHEVIYCYFNYDDESYDSDDSNFSIDDYDIHDRASCDKRRVFDCQEKIVVQLAKHIAKLKAVGLYVSKRNLQSITSYYIIDDFPDKCAGEIKILKSEKIDNSCVSFYDILTKNTHQLAIFARNENIVEAFKSADYKTKFRIYASLIETKFRRGVERKVLMELGNQFFCSLSESFPELPPPCIEKIFSYLSNNDLKLLHRLV